MHEYALTHVSDSVLVRDLAALVARDRLNTASLLAHIAEVDARRLYVPAGYPSMHAYCVDELHLSEDAAAKRIHAARAARRFPALFTALAEGRIHLSGACLLASHLTAENASELIKVASYRRKAEIEEMLARRFPAAELPASVRAITSRSPLLQHAPGHVGNNLPAQGTLDERTPLHAGIDIPAQAILDEHAPRRVHDARGDAPTPERYLVQLTIDKSTHEKLRYAQALLSHAVPSGDVAQVLDRALDSLIAQLEKRKFGATRRPRQPRRSRGRRTVPAHVRRAVWERDQGRCTFVSVGGTRCKVRRFLEFDHVDPVARGGTATVGRIRLRCRAHNQHEAERTFGVGFMERKREEACLAKAEARSRALAKEQSRDVLAGLRGLGCRADEARRAAEFSESLHGASLEERMRAALKFLSRRIDTNQIRT